jgi:hypothetical protein
MNLSHGMALHAGGFLCGALVRRNIYPRKGAGIVGKVGLKAQTISCVLTTHLSSMYAPIIPLAFVLALVCVAFAFNQPEDKS